MKNILTDQQIALLKAVSSDKYLSNHFYLTGKGSLEYGMQLDSLVDIAVNKLFTIYQRTKARDYIDLYFICRKKGLKIDDLIQKAKQKFDWHIDPIQLGTQFVKAADAPDLPRMLIDLPANDWQSFFIKEAKKLKSEILE